MKRTLQLALLLGSVLPGMLHAQSFAYKKFQVPEAATNTLSIDAIDKSGVIVGYLTDTSGNLKGFTRSPNGTITLLVDPLDTSTPSATVAYDISPAGITTGYFFDTSTGFYSGYFYAGGRYETYNVPNQPAGTDSSVGGIYNLQNFCGFVLQPPYTAYEDFISVGGTVTLFEPFGTTQTNCVALNSSNTAVGYYEDSATVIHGWMRTADGTITSIDDPEASTVTGTNPCFSVPIGGTEVLGINDAGYISGHYWDTSFIEHGFIRTPGGKFIPINVPGALQTAGGGINDANEIVGHYIKDSSCDDGGFIAVPK